MMATAETIEWDSAGHERAVAETKALLARSLEIKSAEADADAERKAANDDPLIITLGKLAAGFEGQQRAFEELKASVNAGEREEKKNGAIDPLTTGKIDAINATLSAMQAEVKAAAAAAARPQAAFGPAAEQAVGELKSFNALLSGIGRPAIAEEGYGQYKAAFERYARAGDRGLDDLQVKAMSAGSDPNGGALLAPPMMDTMITRIMGRFSALRTIAANVTLAGPAYRKTVNLTGTSSGWVGETDARTETGTPKVDVIELTPNELYAQPLISQILLDDAGIDMEAMLAAEIGQEFAEREGGAFISGDGVRKPRGLISYTNVANASYAWGSVGYIASGAAGAFPSTGANDKLLDLLHSLKRQYRIAATWLMNDASLGEVRKLKDGQGNFIWLPDNQVPDSSGLLLGKRIYTDDFMPDFAANAFPIAFGDFGQAYTIVNRLGTTILRDPYTSKGNVLFYARRRVGGGIINFEAVKLLRAATT